MMDFPVSTTSPKRSNNKGNGIELMNLSLDVSMPSVTIREPRHKNTHRRPSQNRFRRRMHSSMKWLLLVAPIYFYRQIVDVSLSIDFAFSSPMIRNDYSSIQSIHDLDSHKVHQWCHRNYYDCPCKDPLQPFPRDGDSDWQKAHSKNVELAAKNETWDVVLYGDSLVEQFPTQLFESFFDIKKKNDKPQFQAAAMGISNDTSPNLLWRIQNGELPKITQAKVLWVVIGTHDLGKTHLCSPELVVIGIVRVVEELLLQTSLQTNIVVQGMFPRTYNKDGYLAKSSTLGTGTLSLWQDIQVINEELKLYATYRTRVFYQRPPPLFDDDNLQLNKTLMEPDYLHLTNQGYQLWANQIVQRLKTMKRPTKKRSRYKQR